MRRTYEKLKFLFDVLDRKYSLRCDGAFSFVYLMHMKVTSFLSEALYETGGVNVDVVYKDDGFNYMGFRAGGDDDDEMEYLYENNIFGGSFAHQIHEYAESSPHWEVKLVDLYITESDKGVSKDEGGHFYVTEDFIRKAFGDFFDEEIYEDKEKLKEIQDCYWIDDDFPDGFCIIRSSLYPYFNAFKEVAGEKYPEKIEYLESAFRVMDFYMDGGITNTVSTSKYGYFMNSDNSSTECGSMFGCYDYVRSVMVAPEFIEEIMFSLDEEYNILPEEILKKEKERWEDED